MTLLHYTCHFSKRVVPNLTRSEGVQKVAVDRSTDHVPRSAEHTDSIGKQSSTGMQCETTRCNAMQGSCKTKSYGIYSAAGSSSRSASHASGTSCWSFATGGGGGKDGVETRVGSGMVWCTGTVTSRSCSPCGATTARGGCGRGLTQLAALHRYRKANKKQGTYLGVSIADDGSPCFAGGLTRLWRTDAAAAAAQRSERIRRLDRGHSPSALRGAADTDTATIRSRTAAVGACDWCPRAAGDATVLTDYCRFDGDAEARFADDVTERGADGRELALQLGNRGVE